MELLVPAPIGDEAIARVRELAADVYRSCGCTGLARCDFFVARRRRGPRQRAQHDPGLHRDQRLREALRGDRGRTPSSATGWSRWRSSATRPSAATSTRAKDFRPATDGESMTHRLRFLPLVPDPRRRHDRPALAPERLPGSGGASVDATATAATPAHAAAPRRRCGSAAAPGWIARRGVAQANAVLARRQASADAPLRRRRRRRRADDRRARRRPPPPDATTASTRPRSVTPRLDGQHHGLRRSRRPERPSTSPPPASSRSGRPSASTIPLRRPGRPLRGRPRWSRSRARSFCCSPAGRSRTCSSATRRRRVRRPFRPPPGTSGPAVAPWALRLGALRAHPGRAHLRAPLRRLRLRAGVASSSPSRAAGRVAQPSSDQACVEDLGGSTRRRGR